LNVLALQLKRIGDLILTTPALHALKAAGAHVTLALADNTAPLLPAMRDFVDEALVFERGKLNTAHWWRALTRDRGRHEITLDFTGNDRSALLTLLGGGARRLIARDALKRAPRWRWRAYTDFVETNIRERHTVDRYLDHVRALDLPGKPDESPRPAPVLHAPAEARAAAQQALERCGLRAAAPYAIVHPGSARAEKYWQPERWAAVIAHCQRELGTPVVLTGGRGDAVEEAHLAAIRSALKQPVAADLAGRLDLLALTALIEKAAWFLGVDSGPMHLVAAARRPAVVLFGPTNPFHWRPRHAGCFVLAAQHGGDTPILRGEIDADFSPSLTGAPMSAISSGTVLAALERLPSRQQPVAETPSAPRIAAGQTDNPA
jgi:ADP-heptose:LPS heptosyltransferase